MKICIITNKFPKSFNEPIVSGEIKNPFYLARALKEMGHDVIVITHNFIKDTYFFDGIKVYSAGESILKGVLTTLDRTFKQFKYALKVIKKEKLDIIHGHVLSSIISIIFLKKMRKTHAPIVFTAHGTAIPENYANLHLDKFSLYEFLIKLNGWMQYPIDRFMYINADKVISVSNYQVREMTEIYKVPKNKIIVIPNGVDTHHYKPDRKSGIKLKEKMGLKNKKVILLVGRLVRKKGFQYVVKAAPDIIKEIRDIVFVIIGGIDWFAKHELELRKVIRKSSLENKFIILKGIPESEMPVYYNSADVCVVPSINYESIPTVILEAMACGIPVIATNRWGIPEIIKCKEVLVPEKDVELLAIKIVNLLKNKELANALSEQNRKIAKLFDWQIIAEKHQLLYRSLLG